MNVKALGSFVLSAIVKASVSKFATLEQNEQRDLLGSLKEICVVCVQKRCFERRRGRYLKKRQ